MDNADSRSQFAMAEIKANQSEIEAVGRQMKHFKDVFELIDLNSESKNILKQMFPKENGMF